MTPDSQNLPSGWEQTTVAGIAESIQYGHTASANENAHGPRFLRITDIQNGQVDWATVPSCELTDEELPRYRLKAGDLVFARTGATTAAGVAVRTGMAAADPALLPLGSVVQVQTPVARHNGIWTVLDTGPEVKGRELDLYMWSCNDALAFGRQTAQVTILRLGWDPQNSAPAGVEQLFRRRERAVPAPVAPPPADPAATAPPAPPSAPPSPEAF